MPPSRARARSASVKFVNFAPFRAAKMRAARAVRIGLLSLGIEDWGCGSEPGTRADRRATRGRRSGESRRKGG